MSGTIGKWLAAIALCGMAACGGTTATFDGECGDGNANEIEECDGADLKGAIDCGDVDTSLAGTLACTSTCTLDTSGCTSSEPLTVIVTQDGVPQAGVLVAAGLADEEPTEAVTDAAGEARLFILGFVKAGLETRLTIAQQNANNVTLRTYYDLVAGDLVRLDRSTPVPPTAVGTGTITLPGALAGATLARVLNGCGSVTTANFASTPTINFSTSCLGSGNVGDVVILAEDAAGNTLGWNHLQQIVAGATTFTFNTWNSTIETIQNGFVNVPPGHATLEQSCSWRIGEASHFRPEPPTTNPVGSTFISNLDIPGGGTESLTCSSTLDQSLRASSTQLPPYAPVVLDGNQLPAPISNYVPDVTDPEHVVARFDVGLTGNLSADVTSWIYFATNTATNVNYTIEVIAPGNATELAIPVLPASPAWDAFRLTGTTRRFAGSDRVTKIEHSKATGYKDFVRKTPADLAGVAETYSSVCFGPP